VFTVVAKYEKGYTDLGTPPAMRYAVVTNSTLLLQGSTTVSGDVHANGTLDTRGVNFEVLGQGSYTNTLSTDDNDNFGGGIIQQDSIHIDPVVIPTTGVDQTITQSTFTLNGTTVSTLTGGGTQADPFVLVIYGNLAVTGNVVLPGHTQIYVTGTIDIGANTRFAALSTTAINANTSSNDEIQAWIDASFPDGITLGLNALGEITFGGTALIAAHMHTNETFDFGGGGNQLVVGGIVAEDDLTLFGNVKVFYTDANVSIIPGGTEDVPDGMRLVAYREWAQRPSDPTP
jgi:hypothetical protein